MANRKGGKGKGEKGKRESSLIKSVVKVDSQIGTFATDQFLTTCVPFPISPFPPFPLSPFLITNALPYITHHELYLRAGGGFKPPCYQVAIARRRKPNSALFFPRN